MMKLSETCIHYSIIARLVMTGSCLFDLWRLILLSFPVGLWKKASLKIEYCVPISYTRHKRNNIWFKSDLIFPQALLGSSLATWAPCTPRQWSLWHIRCYCDYKTSCVG